MPKETLTTLKTVSSPRSENARNRDNRSEDHVESRWRKNTMFTRFPAREWVSLNPTKEVYMWEFHPINPQRKVALKVYLEPCDKYEFLDLSFEIFDDLIKFDTKNSETVYFFIARLCKIFTQLFKFGIEGIKKSKLPYTTELQTLRIKTLLKGVCFCPSFRSSFDDLFDIKNPQLFWAFAAADNPLWRQSLNRGTLNKIVNKSSKVDERIETEFTKQEADELKKLEFEEKQNKFNHSQDAIAILNTSQIRETAPSNEVSIIDVKYHVEISGKFNWAPVLEEGNNRIDPVRKISFSFSASMLAGCGETGEQIEFLLNDDTLTGPMAVVIKPHDPDGKLIKSQPKKSLPENQHGNGSLLRAEPDENDPPSKRLKSMDTLF
jgi:hypothetical protein